MRNLTKTITAISLLAPVSAFPLGIGDIRLNSALNQNLDAEIALHISAGENISDLQVKLAPPAKFDEAGVPWNYFLSKIKFEATKANNGSTVIKVTSKEALREPFLDFLVEVSWDKGSLYREFTVLVDPPVAYTQPVSPVIDKTKQVERKPDVTKKVTVAKVKVGNSKKLKSASFFDGQYGPTEKNDSLWKVAEKTNADAGISRAQMMMAIYDANPKAFYKQNVNALKAGKTLKIPEKEVILNLTKKDAQLAFKKQTEEWVGVDENDALTQVGNKEPNPELELKVPTDAEITDTEVVAGKNSEDSASSQSNPDQSAIALTENSIALHAKMEKLEQQLAMMQKMLVLKDEQIAVLQNQKQLTDTSASVSVEESQDEKILDNKAEQKEDKKNAAVDADDGNSVAKPDVKVEPVAEVEEPETISTAMMSAIVFPVLGLLGWALWRKGKDEDEAGADSESMFASASEIIPVDTIANDEPVSSVDEVTSITDELDDSSFLSEFASSDFHTFDKDSSDDVDPVLEADVYLAYGRYQQAEELMRQAIIDQPERDECKLKLLEIFHAHKNTSDFEEYVVELEKSGKNNNQKFWSKVVEMSEELDMKSVSSSLNEEKKEVLDSSALTEPSENEAISKKNDNEVEFDLSIFDEDEKKNSSDIDKKIDEEFDLNQFTLTESDSPTVDKSNKKATTIETFDFDFNTIPEKELDLGVSDLTDMDEIETKIDLAKAYIDMGDYDSAKTIAKEAFERGNDEQKKVAEGILDLLD